MNKLQDWLGRRPARVALLLYLSVGLFQVWTIPAGLESWFGLHWMWAVVGATALAWIPLVGQALGLAAAVDPLNWPLAAALALFLWPVWLFAGVLAARRFNESRRSAKFPPGEDEFDRRVEAVRNRRAASRTQADDLAPPARTAA